MPVSTEGCSYSGDSIYSLRFFLNLSRKSNKLRIELHRTITGTWKWNNMALSGGFCVPGLLYSLYIELHFFYKGTLLSITNFTKLTETHLMNIWPIWTLFMLTRQVILLNCQIFFIAYQCHLIAIYVLMTNPTSPQHNDLESRQNF